MRAVVGFRAHSGWAAAVVLGGPPDAPEILDRRRVETADPSIAGSKQPFHAAEELPFRKAEALIELCTASSRRLALREVERIVSDVRAQGHGLEQAVILLSSARPLPDLARVLASHAWIHTAEGELFRDVLRRAAHALGLAVTGISERAIAVRTATIPGVSEEKWRRSLAAMGKRIGPPWRQDEKLAATAAWFALAGGPRGAGRRRTGP